MSATITVTDDHPQFGAIVALLSGTSLSSPNAPTISTTGTGAVSPQVGTAPIQPAPFPAAINGDDDDNGPTNANAPAVDNTGLPWDERIHAATKNTNADGTWKARRGGPKGEQLAAIEAELRSQSAAPMPSPQPAPVPMTVPTMQPQPVPMPSPQPMPTIQPQPVPMPSPQPMPTMQPVPMPMPEQVQQPQPVAATAAPTNTAAAPEPATAQATGTLDFAQFMQHISQQMAKRDGAGGPLIHADYLAQITAEIGGAFDVQLSAITDIAANPQMITYAQQCMQRDGRW